MPNIRAVSIQRAGGRSRNRGRSGRTRRNRMATTEPVLSEKNLGTIRLPGVPEPPIHITNPQVTRVVRITTAYSGSALSLTVSPKALVDQDALDYLGATTTSRYGHLRVTKIEGWLGLQSFGSGLPTLVMYDGYSDVYHNDVAAVGVDYAHIAFRPCLSMRMTNFGATDTSSTVAGINVPASEGAVGTLTVDYTVTFM